MRHSQPTKPARKHRSAAPAPHHGQATAFEQARSRSAPGGGSDRGGRGGRGRQSGGEDEEVMLREGRVIERVQMKQRASTTSLEDVARLQKQSEELEKVCATRRSISANSVAENF